MRATPSQAIRQMENLLVLPCRFLLVCVCCFIVSASCGSHLFNSRTPPAKLWRKQEQEKKQLLTRRISSPFSMMMAGIEEKEKSGIQCNHIKSLYVGVDDDKHPGGSEDLHVDVDDEEHGKDDDCHVHTCS